MEFTGWRWVHLRLLLRNQPLPLSLARPIGSEWNFCSAREALIASWCTFGSNTECKLKRRDSHLRREQNLFKKSNWNRLPCACHCKVNQWGTFALSPWWYVSAAPGWRNAEAHVSNASGWCKFMWFRSKCGARRKFFIPERGILFWAAWAALTGRSAAADSKSAIYIFCVASFKMPLREELGDAAVNSTFAERTDKIWFMFILTS